MAAPRKITSAELTAYINEVGAMPPEAMLGYIGISTVPDDNYDREALVDAFKSRGLDEAYVPMPSTPVNAFRRATTEHASTQYTLPSGDVVTLLLRSVRSTSKQVTIKVITRELSTRKQAGLAYDGVGEIHLFHPARKGDDRKVDLTSARVAYLGGQRDRYSLSDEEWDRIKQVATNVRNDFETYRTHVSGAQLRNELRRYLRHLGAVIIKDSVWFVPAVNAPMLESLSGAYLEMGARLELVPVVDIPGQRDIVLRSYQEDTEAQMASLAEELVRARGSVTPKSYARLRARYDELAAVTDLYTETLGEGVERTSGAHEVVKSTLAALAGELLRQEAT